ncbi:MAG: hypothetical protein KA756_06595, partial [Steroidobacteraceae bacterium]|nr:hypothetical protein [Steroidobacteraceae bacterium]
MRSLKASCRSRRCRSISRATPRSARWRSGSTGGPVADVRLAGIGMTSARTRDRLVQRLREQGIRSPEVLDRIRNVPRHIFVDEALASRAYEDTALP